MSLQCSECNKDFTVKSNLTRHLRMIHNIDIKRCDVQPVDYDVYQYKCLEGCKISFKYNRDLRQHLKEQHKLELTELHLEFPNSEEFKKWLHNEEMENCVQFVHTTATKKRSTGVETDYYECSRSGRRIEMDDTTRKRRPKKQGTQKLNRGCTSQIIAYKYNEGTYSVNYFKTHYGHDIEIEHLKLSKQERGAIASKLLLGIPVSAVLNSVQTTKSGTLRRINLLERKDVFNIKRAFNIKAKDGKTAPGHSFNINLFINEAMQREYNPILYNNLKEVTANEGICIMIMSEFQSKMLFMHSIDNIVVVNSTSLGKCDFELTTLYVCDSNNIIYPGACMFHMNKDVNVYELFFSKILEKIGQLSPAIFVGNKIYYEAWRTVMGDVTNWFYSPKQVDLDWRLNLNQIICAETDATKVKRKWVYDTLKILENIADENEFFENFEETIKLLESDEDFKDFLEYFLENYNDPKKWAECYKQNTNIELLDFNLFDECLVKYIDKDSRFDKIFHSIIRYIRDETLNYMAKIDSIEGITTRQDIRHELIHNKFFEVEGPVDDVWSVTYGETYIVQRHLKKKCCNIICNSCNICVHCFSCTCIDYFVNNSICIHIHYLWLTSLKSIEEKETDSTEEQTEEMTLEIQDDDQPCETEEIIIEMDMRETDVKGLRDEIIDRISDLCSNIGNIECEDTLKFVLENINNLCTFVTNNSVEQTNESVEESENNITTSEHQDTVMNDHSYL